MRPLARRAAIGASLGAATGLLAAPRLARAADSIKFSLDFRIYAETAPNLYGLDLGYFREEGIEVVMDGSSGSVDAITRVASGVYDFGVADVSSLIEFGSRNPGVAPKVLVAAFDRSASAIVSMKQRNITTLAALQGKTLGVSTADAGSRILPSLLRLNRIDESTIRKVTIDPKLRNTMMLRGDVDAVVGQSYTVLFDVASVGVKDTDLSVIEYADHGFDVYAQSLIASRRHVEGNPDLVRRVARAWARSWVAAIRDPQAAVQSAVRRDGLLDGAVETARLRYLLAHSIVTPNTRENGFGAIDTARLTRAIETVSSGFGLSRTPATDEIFAEGFMPPIADRRIA